MARSEETVTELVRLAIDDYDAENQREQPFRAALKHRGDAEVLDAMRALANSPRCIDRALAADVLGELGFPRTFPDESARILLEMLASERDPLVLSRIGFAFGHLNDPAGTEPLSKLRDHPDPDVRLGVAFGLSCQDDDRAIATLIELTSDPKANVRDWATFGLGTQIDSDSPEIRNALRRVLDDGDPNVRFEALTGLALRGDSEVVPRLLDELKTTGGEELEEALIALAYKTGDPRLCEPLASLGPKWSERSWQKDQLAVARERCQAREQV